MPQPPLDPRRCALIVFDMLNAHVRPADSEKAARIAATGVVEGCVAILQAARAAGVAIFYTNGGYRADGQDFIATLTDANMDLEPWPDGPRPMSRPGVPAGERAGAVIDELAPRPQDFAIAKLRWSAFVGTELDLLLRHRGIDTLLIAGGSTDVGILATAINARDLGYQVVILRDACQSQRPGAQDYCMERLFPRLARVMTVAQASALLAQAV